jgi:hypothetical protein
MDWTITIEAAGGTPSDVTDEQLFAFLRQLEPISGAVTGTPEISDVARYGAMVSFEGIADVLDAQRAAIDAFTGAAESVGLPRLPIVRIDAMTFDEQARELAS